MVLMWRVVLSIFVAIVLLTPGPGLAADEKKPSESEIKSTITLSKDMGETMVREATKVRRELGQKARSLFERESLGWNPGTINHLYKYTISLPGKIPELTRKIVEQSRVLGTIGSILILVFIMAVLYSLLGQRRVLGWVERKFQPLGERIPEKYYPYFQSGLKVVVSALIPLVLLGLFSLIHSMIGYRAAWFHLVGRLLGLWVAVALVLGLLKEFLTRDFFPLTLRYGKTLFRWTQLVLLYVLVGIAAYWIAEAFQIREDVLELFKFAVSVSIVVVLFLIFLRKEAFMSLFPELPYHRYQWFINLLNKYYYPLLFVSFFASLLWCVGYKALGRLVLIKIWFTTAAFLLIVLIYYALNNWMKRWAEKLDAGDDAAQLLVRSLKSVLLYATVIATVIVLLNLLGLLDPLQRIMSFPIFQLGTTTVTFWIIVKAVLILLIFIFASRLLQAYMDYSVYPSLGIDPGLGYALNTFFKYASVSIGLLISLKVVGIDLRLLLVFAGAIGIGIGFGLQNMAANVISGFTIIFGGKIRKGDWIEVEGTMGVVTDIYLRATKVRTRDNIEYLIPNLDLISKTTVNYSLSSPMIRIELPVGVSYSSDPRVVERILIEVAEREPLVSKYKKPLVRFVEYADSSLNFELLIWINVREIPRRKVRSALYFAIFEEFKKADIEIPFPQRDIHIRSKVD